MAMNKQRRTSNINNIVRYDTSGNVSLPAGLTVEGLDAGFVKSDANGLFSIDTGAYLPTPSQSGNAGKYLTTDGSVLSWGTVSTNNIYNSNGTLTGNRTVTSGGYNLTFTGTNTASSALATGVKMSHTLVAAANNDVLVGLDIAPTFTNGAFTDNRNIGLRVQSGRVVIGTDTGSGYPPTLIVSSNQTLFSTSPAHSGLWVSETNSGNAARIAFFSNTFPTNFSLGQTGSTYSGMANKSFLHSNSDIWVTQSGSGTPDSANNTMVFFNSTRNITIGGTTDSGYKLDVQGTARVTGNATILGRTIFGADYFASTSSTFGWYSDGNNPLRIYSALTGGFSLLNLSSGGQLSLMSGIDGNRVYIARNAEADTTTSYTSLFTSQTSGGARNLSNWSKIITNITTEGGGSVSNAPSITYLNIEKGNVTGYSSYKGIDVKDLDSYFGSTSGNVAIGSSATPAYKLSVTGAGGFTGDASNNAIYISTGKRIFFNNREVAIGESVTATYEGVGVGYSINANSGGILIGKGLSNSTFTNVIMLGYNDSSTLTATSSGTLNIGSSNTSGVAIFGATSGAGTNREIAIYGTTSGAGIEGNIAIGRDANASGPYAIALGAFAAAGSGEFVAGCRDKPVTNVYFGGGNQSTSRGVGTGTAYTINGSGAFGTDFAGGNITIAGGKGTGTGTAGDVIISTATPTTTGSTLQTLSNRVWIKGENGNVGIGASPNASYKLDVAGTGRFTNMLSVITTGTTNEVALFKSTEPYITIEAAGGSNSASIFFRPSTSAQNATIQNRTGGGIEFYTGATPSLAATITSANNLVVGTVTAATQKLQVTSSSADNHILVWGSSAPSIRIDNAATGSTQRLVFGLATATNNFITGSVAGDICMTTQSSSPLLFGANATEAMRISTAARVLVGKTLDGGQRFQVNGTVNFTGLPTSSSGLASGDLWNNGGVLSIV